MQPGTAHSVLKQGCITSSEKTTFLAGWAVVNTSHSAVCLPGCQADHWLMLSLLSPAPPGLFFQSCSTAACLSVCACVWHCFVPGTALGIFLRMCAVADCPVYVDFSVRPLVPPGSQQLLQFNITSALAEMPSVSATRSSIKMLNSTCILL